MRHTTDAATDPLLAARPIAVFDSGVGGFTVVAALQRLLPAETLLYLGDTARLPYGTKSPQVVQRYALACAHFLCNTLPNSTPPAPLPPKLFIVACNTASAYALPYLQQQLAIPVLGVIEPSARHALAVQAAPPQGTARRLGVIGTEGTIASGCYQRLLQAYSPGCTVLTQACPLLVPLAEEQLTEHPATRMLVEEYLAPLLAARMDTLILGCTHYPLFTPLLQAICGASVHIVDSAHAVATAAQTILQARHALAVRRHSAHRFYATDVNSRLQRVGSAFLGEPIGSVEAVDIPPGPTLFS